MATLLVWYNLIFYIPVAVGLVFILGIAVGVADLHAPELDADADADVDADSELSHGHELDAHVGEGFLAFLGFGKVPLAVLVMIMLLTFGGTGAAINFFLAEQLAANALFVLVPIAIATIVMIVATSTVGRFVARFLPTVETDSTTKHDLIGCTGVLVLPADARGGLAQIQRRGDVYRIQCRAGETLGKGEAILVTDYDEQTKTYSVCREPVI